MIAERIQKVLANIGLGSRREIERWIENGEILVNGKPAKLGDKITGKEKIILRGKPVRVPKQAEAKKLPKVLLYHKPAGEITTRQDPERRPSVFQNLPKLRHARWITIGRLDFNTSGLLMFTDDGSLAHHLMHPAQEIEREYAVRVLGEVSEAALENLSKGVLLEDGMAGFDKVFHAGGMGANQWYHVILKEGRNREVRRLWESQGLTVSRLIRVRYGNMQLPSYLKAKHYIELKDKELRSFLKDVNYKI